MIATRLTLAAFSAVALLAATLPAHAQGWRNDGYGYGYHREEHREREWREREWREREWREREWRERHRPFVYGYLPPPAVIIAPRW
jgi:hypothetical protein